MEVDTLKKFLIIYIYWWAIIFPSLNFEIPTNDTHIEFRFKIIELKNQRTQFS